MELTPQTLREVEFREKLRGYHPDDVDEFLERCAVAVGDLLARLEAAEGGRPIPPAIVAARLPAPAPLPAGPPTAESIADEALKRTLALAQRTADLAISEAETTARQIVDRAHEDALHVKQRAETDAEALLASARTQVDAMIGDLESRRGSLEREIAALHAWATQHRDRIRDALSEQVRSLDLWLASNPPPRPVRPGLRSASASGARRPVGRRDPATTTATAGGDASHEISTPEISQPEISGDLWSGPAPESVPPPPPPAPPDNEPTGLSSRLSRRG